jgi:hypothetical protein
MPVSDDRTPPDDQAETGAPVTELKELLEPPRAGFLARIRGSIHRRLFAADTADFVFQAFFATLLDYLDLLMRSLPGVARSSAKEKD